MNIEEIFTRTDFSLDLVLFPLFAGVILAMLIVLYNKLVTGRLVRYLIKNEITGEENAVTLTDAGCGKNLLLKLALKDGTTFRKVVYKAGGEGEARYYLPEDKQGRASTAYDNKGASVFAVLIGAVLFTGALLLLRILIPDAVTMIGNVIDMFKEL